MSENQLCRKKDQEGNECRRDRGHGGPCIYVTKIDGYTSRAHVFQPGWIDQGGRPARRKLFLWIASLGGLLAICGYIAIFNWMGWVMLGLLLLAMLVAGPGSIKRIFNEYDQERRKTNG